MPSINFKGKSYVQNHHFSVKYHQLVPNEEYSLSSNINLHENLIIEGDNLLVLKSLLPLYAGKIKCVCIDPPYNTGNEGWQYNDNVNSPMMIEWLNENKPIDREDLTRHDKWLCMMLPRLKLVRELLTQDGVVFIHLDENEIHRLRMLMDEIFGEENYIETIIWKKRSGAPNDKVIAATHEYILAYAKNHSTVKLNLKERSEKVNARYSNPDNHPKGAWTAGDLMGNIKGGRYTASLHFPITNPNTGEEHYPSSGGNWRFSKETIDTLLRNDEIYFGKDGKGRPKLKRFLSEVKDGMPYNTIWDEVPLGQTGSYEIAEILGNINSFDTVKPKDLIVELLKLGSDKDSIILDAFAGSGTTGHAVLDLNASDNGNRRFILVEMEKYAKTITAERVKRVIQGVSKSKNPTLKNGYQSSFSYFQLGSPIEMNSILQGTTLPDYMELARYVFYTATGEEFNSDKIRNDEKRPLIGETDDIEVYLFYKPDLDYLMHTSLNLEKARNLGEPKEKKRLVFAPMKYLDADYLSQFRIEFCQLPFEIYRFRD